MFDSAKLMYQSSAGFYPYKIDQSLRFNDDDSAYLSRTPASAGNRKTWTWSGWVKRGSGTFYPTFFGASNGVGSTAIRFFGDDTIDIFDYTSTTNFSVNTNAAYRDNSAWYHIVVAFDTTQATASNRIKLYVNGVQVTSFKTANYPNQNTDWAINNSTLHAVGGYLAYATNSLPFDGYLAEVNFIDGTALDPTSFGEFKSGVWIPKAYSGSYGTNGFYLDFDGTYYNDKSGNGNNWTANNLAATDVVLDSPTNNFATLNPLAIGPRNNGADSSGILSEGNLKLVLNGSADDFAGTISVSSGKWYFEATLDTATNHGTGWVDVEYFTNGDYSGSTSGIVNSDAFYGTAESSTNSIIVEDGSTSASNNQFSNGDIIGYALNIDSGTLDIYHNGSLDTQITGIPQATYVPIFGDDSSTDAAFTANFGQDSSFAGNKTAQGNTDANGKGDFYYAPPSGYLALCTANLPDPVASIDPAQDGSPQDHFNTVLYTGDGVAIGSGGQSITGVGFQPDWTWTKTRSDSGSNVWYDAVRGATKLLLSNATNAEATNTETLDSFDADGFTVGNAGFSNNSGTTYVAWNWKANGSGVSNTDGSITSTVSANTDAGFSIVSWNQGTTSGTIGHGLNSAPEVIIAKNRSSTQNWYVYHHSVASDAETDYLRLDSTQAVADLTVWNDTAPTSSVFSIGSGILYNADVIAYCFHSVAGFSKFGSYTGNGSTDGPFCYTGFRPAFLMIKATSFSQSDTNWDILNTATGTYNVIGPALRANLSSAEVTYSGWDLLSNGFKLRNIGGSLNYSGETYIYMAFAENPFKYANAR